jgi:N-acyl-D-aspartate/D-glutamate deacylase
MTALSSVSSKAPEYDLIIKNGRVIDGSGRPAFSGDIAT